MSRDITLPGALLLNEQTMSELNLIPGYLKAGVRVKMKRMFPADDAIATDSAIPDDDYHRGVVISVSDEETLIMWSGELFPCTTSRKHWDKISAE